MSAVPSTSSETGDSSSAEVTGAATRVQLTASDRLALSRQRLRHAMRDGPASLGDVSKQRGGGSGAAWLDGMKAIPGVNVLIELASSWWAQHPLRIASMVAADATKAEVQPMAQRHPWALCWASFCWVAC